MAAPMSNSELRKWYHLFYIKPIDNMPLVKVDQSKYESMNATINLAKLKIILNPRSVPYFISSNVLVIQTTD